MKRFLAGDKKGNEPVKRYPPCNRLVLVALAALLALPLTQSDSPAEARKRARANAKTFANPAAVFLPEYDSDLPAEALL